MYISLSAPAHRDRNRTLLKGLKTDTNDTYVSYLALFAKSGS